MPPLPMPWNLPFQSVSGSHTSKLMAGAMTPATRQKAGASTAADPAGGVKPPAGANPGVGDRRIRQLQVDQLLAGRGRPGARGFSGGAAARAGGQQHRAGGGPGNIAQESLSHGLPV